MNNLMQMLQQFNSFKSQIQRSGKQPEQLLNELIQSGQINQQQLDQAKQMANLVKNIMGGKIL